MSQDDRLSDEAKADIQGFITSGFGHLPYSAYLFLEIRRRGQARSWLQGLWPQVTTSASWRRHRDAPKAKPPRTLNVAFTYAGLAALGVSEAGLRAFPPEFRMGMASRERAHILGDTGESDPVRWEFGGPQNETIHIVLILNGSTHADLDAWCEAQRQAVRKTRGGIVEHRDVAQSGVRPEHGREPFGFFDGVAQPAIEGVKGEGVRTGEFVLGYLNEYGFYPVSPVVPAGEDPRQMLPASANPNHQAAGYRDFGFNGTFVVYRKLAQDVAGFWRFVQNESVRHKGTIDVPFMVWLASKMVGRWPSGAPLILTPEQDRPELHSDDFAYALQDPDGLVCPLGSHIRRTNPRDQLGPAGPTESLHMSARHRILRRGKPYGPQLYDPAVLTKLDYPEALQAIVNLQDDGQPRGVHFLCVNASIKSQFEFIQQAWVNNPGFGGLINNRDPLAGDNDPASAPGVMIVPGKHATLRTAPLPRLITTRGGVYLFMPSLTALRYLAEMR